MNSWLDPSQVGAFDENRTMEIRTALTIEDTPSGIPGAVYPTKEDLLLHVEEFQISPGDVLEVEIFELRRRELPYERQVEVRHNGMVNLPVLGRIQAEGLTPREFENELVEQLRDREILLDPDVTVNPLYLQKATYSVFGIGASASANAQLRAGTFPIRRPNLRLLEAINLVGGLNELVTEVYVFREDDPFFRAEPPEIPSPEPQVLEEEAPQKPEPPAPVPSAPEETPQEETKLAPSEDASAEAELIEAVVDQTQQADEDQPVPPDLEVEPTQPWIFVNGEFVPNPAFEEAQAIEQAPLKEVTRYEAESPAVDWERIAGRRNYRIIRVPAETLRSGDPEFNIYVRAGDVIRIVSGEVGVYYVMGQVGQVGVYRFMAEPITLKSAIAAAGGLTPSAWPTRCTVYRRIGPREQMIQVNLDRIFAGKDPDFFIKRGDIINVGTHPFSPWLQRIRAWTLPTPTNLVGYSFTYSRNFADIDSYGSRINPHNEPDRFPNLFP
ncbi:MAG: polysaccharide biosynthesis/export family protein [Phycisphaerales bacterium]|nr:MAG: polysaccharide biosynthesis/export family protein [Phycisphaerales bacterium]